MYQSNYDRYPKTRITGHDSDIQSGAADVAAALSAAVAARGGQKTVLTAEIYPGADKAEIRALLERLHPAALLDVEDCAHSPERIEEMMREELTEDRVFGVMTTRTLSYYFDDEKLESIRQTAGRAEKGLIILYGTGASLASRGDLLVYFSMARWEIQLRYRAGMPNWRARNADAPILSKYKRGFFVEWRLADKLKKGLLDEADYFVDANKSGRPVMATGEAYREGLRQVSSAPFRVQPYFDPGVWGGQWMKQVCGLDPDKENYAWSFDGVPEENSLLMQFGSAVFEAPAIDVVLYRPGPLLGERVHARFGTEFPIRFDFLDTMGGQNLSLQVHPLTEYIQEKFNMRYTQDESYYILDAAQEDTYVYLGVKNGVDKNAMMRDLRRAQEGEASFPAETYINKIPVKKHDHVLIPAGTVHCSGANTMVLEISATPYIFTFKLWDWDRVGLDGLPRPIHLDHGEQNIQWDRDTDWIKENLVGQTRLMHEEEGIRVERTGLHEREFIDTVRTTFSKPASFNTGGSVNVLNLIEGRQAVVTSPEGRFAPFTVHYAETFIVPAAVGDYRIEPQECQTAAVIQASVRR